MVLIRKNALTSAIGRQRADWSDLRVFYAVVELGSITQAAAALGLTQPTVTRRIEELEGRLGAKLLNRTAEGLSLTEAGELVYDRVLTMERSAGAIERLVFNKDREEEGRVGVLAPDGVAAFILAPNLPDFLRTNPKIAVSLDCGFWPDSPLSSEIDVSLQFDPVSNPDVIATPIATFHYGLYASQSYIDLYGAPASLAQSAEHRYIHHPAQKRQKEKWGQKWQAFQGLAQVSFESNCSAATLAAIKNGAGIGALPTAIHEVEPDLVMLDLPHGVKATLWMCVHSDAVRTARIRRVMDWMTSIFDQRTKPWYRSEFVHPSEFATWSTVTTEADVA
jgi:DNA-binding transcriptional LysR family regulator